MKKGLQYVFGCLGVIFLLCLSLSNFSHAQIIYRDLVPDGSFTLANSSSPTGLAPVDLDNDGTPDFDFRYEATDASKYIVHIVPLNNNEVLTSTAQDANGINYVFPLLSGNAVSSSPYPQQAWGTADPILVDQGVQNFAIGMDRFIGVRLKSGSDWLYGWIRVNISAMYPVTVTVKDVGYESNIANTSILANQNLQSSASFISDASSVKLDFSEVNTSEPLYACNSTKSIKLTIHPQVSSLSGKIKIKIADASNGLYIAAGSVSNNAAVLIDNAGSTEKFLVLVLNNLTSNAEIIIPVYASYCNIFGAQEQAQNKVISSVFAADFGLSVATNLSLNINRGAAISVVTSNDPFATIRTAGSDPNNNNLVTFQFSLNNSSDEPFSGWVLFQESAASLGTAFDIRAVKYYLYNPSTGTQTLVHVNNNPATTAPGDPNNNSFITSDNPDLSSKLLYVTIPAKYILLIKEEVRVNGCLTSPKNKAQPILSWGCGDYTKVGSVENCATASNNDTNINDNVLAAFSYVPEKSNYYHTYICAGDYRETKYVTHQNTGTGIAYNVKLKMRNDNWTTYLVEKDPSKIYIEITRNGVTTRYAPDLTNYDLDPVAIDAQYDQLTFNSPSDLPAPFYLPDSWFTDNVQNTAVGFSYQNGDGYDINAAHKLKDVHLYQWGRNDYDPTAVSYDNMSCGAPDQTSLGEKRFIYRLIIDRYWDPATNSYQKINLDPGDQVTMGWEQYKCCNSASNAPNGYAGLYEPSIFIKFNTGCISDQNYATSERYGNYAGYAGNELGGQMKIESYNPTTRGDVDWCTSTKDGAVERITSEFTEGLYIGINEWQQNTPKDANGVYTVNTDEPFQNWDGDIVYRIYLEQGIDLDRALSGAVASGFLSTAGYNDVVYNGNDFTTNGTGCTEVCTGCSLTNTLSPNQFHVVIRKDGPGGTVIQPASITLSDFNTDYQPAVQLDNFKFISSDNSRRYASNIYEVRFHLQDLINSVPDNGISLAVQPMKQKLQEFLTGAFLDADVRVYCAKNSFPYFKIVSFLDKCGGTSTCDLNKNGYTAMHPLTQVSGKFLVNCPGCLVPGANVNTGSVTRDEMGNPDVDDDGVADNGTTLPLTHPNARVISNGDLFTINMSIAMSNGISKDILDENGRNKGCLKEELDASNYFLNNLYVQIPLNGLGAWYADPENTIMPIGAEASIDGGTTWQPMTIYNKAKTDAYLLLRINSEAFSPTKTSFGVSENIMVRFHGKMGYISGSTDNFEIQYRAGFSACSTCDSYSNFIIVNGTLNNGISGAWPNTYISYDDLVQHSNTFFICTTFSNNFKFVPRQRTMYFYTDTDNSYYASCQKTVNIITRQSFEGGSNVYKGEIRNSGDTRVIELPIPAGYEVSQLKLLAYEDVDPAQKLQHLDLTTNPPEQYKSYRYWQQYTLKQADFSKNNWWNNLIQIIPTSDPAFPNKLVLTMPNTTVPNNTGQANPYDPNLYRLHYMVLNDQWISATNPLMELDESFQRNINVTLTPAANVCLNNNDIVYTDNSGGAQLKGNLGDWWSVSSSESWRQYFLRDLATTADLTYTAYGSWNTPANHEFFRLIVPKANMSLAPAQLSNYEVSNEGLVQVPVTITLNPIDANGNRFSAEYPFLHIKGLGIQEGLVLRAVYRGLPADRGYTDNILKNAWSPNNWANGPTNFIRSQNNEYIVGLDQDYTESMNMPYLESIGREPYINYTQLTFTLVFSYNCQSCSSLVATSCQDNSTNACLTGNNLQVAYGYNCKDFPTFADLANNSVCKYYDPINFSITNQKIYVDATNYINGTRILPGFQASILPCSTFTYKVNLNSCKSGGVTAADIGLTLPSGYSVVSSPADVTFANGNYHVNFAPALNIGATRDLEFQIMAPCRIDAQDQITCSVSALAYCGQNIPIGSVSTKLKLDNSIPDLTSVGVAFDNITVANPTTDVYANGTTLSVNYTVAGASGSSATKNDNTLKIEVSGQAATIISIPANTTNGVYTAQIALPNLCADYNVTVTPTLGYITPCGINNGVEDPTCKNTIDASSIVNTTIHITASIGVGVGTNNGQAAFLCGSGGSATFIATGYPSGGNYSYSWTGPGIVGPNTGNTITVNVEGTYHVTMTDNNCHITATNSINAIGHIDVQCPQPICPGDIPTIQVLNAGNTGGTYTAQWYDPNGSDTNDPTDLAADILMDHGIFVSGYYYAAAITPSCTLRTNMHTPDKRCMIEVKRAPQPYHITTNKPSGDAPVVFLCDGQQVTFSVTNKGANSAHPTDVIWRSGQTTLDDVIAPGSWTDPGGNVLTAKELEDYHYFIVAIDEETHCRTLSNEIAIETPRIAIVRSCESGSQVKLTAVSNFQVAANQYDWQLDGNGFAQSTDHVIATQAGAYSVTEHSTGCTLYNRCWGIKENLNTSGAPNSEMLSIQDGGFEGITDCNVTRGFDTDYDCIDRSGYNGSALPADYTVDHFMINQPGLQASNWSPNTPSTWVNNNTTFTGDGAMFIDGQSAPTAKLIWGKTVPVVHGYNYLYRFKVRDINISATYPVQEIPELYVQQTYYDAQGNGTRYKTNKEALFNNGTNPWIEFSSFTPALPDIIPSCQNPSEITSMRVELFMDGGGAIGRDLSVDDVSLIPIGICDDVIQLHLPCNTALADLQNNHQVVCPGTTATFDVVNAPAGLTFKW
ncbi:MAG TPA: PKD domain-containing protein, partial [Cytophagaceae bacterium]|nr:PKD domain-containing protein [Cytophagaceae bacterium]